MNQGPAEKLLNKWLFATTRYLDSHGNHANAAVPTKILSAPEMKTSAFVVTGLALAFAAARMPLETYFALYNISPPILITAGKNWKHLHTVPKEFYFDTQPDRKKEINDPVLLALLKVDHKGLKRNLLSATAFTILPAVAASIMFPFTAPMATAFALPLFVNMVTSDVGKWWRADQTLKGHWNVTTHIPSPEARKVMQEEHAAMPQPSAMTAPQLGQG